MIRYPNITGKNDAQKLDQMKSYLHQLADELNYQLDNTSKIGSGYPSSSVEAGAVAKPVKKDDAISNFNEIKGLIIKSADIVDAYSEQISETLRGEYVAVSDFGTYTQETLAELEIGADEIRSSLTKVESIDDDIKNAVQSEIKQTAESITLEVDNGESTAAIKMKVGDRELEPATIDMKGLVTFSNLANADGTTVINGSNITTGQILAELIKAGIINPISYNGTGATINLDEGHFTAREGDRYTWITSSGLTAHNGDDFADIGVFGSTAGVTLIKRGISYAKFNAQSDGLVFLELCDELNDNKLRLATGYGYALLKGLTAPVDPTDAVNKAYVDGNFASAYRAVYTAAELDALRGSCFFSASVGVIDNNVGWWGYQTAQDDRYATQKIFTYNGTSQERTMWDGVWQPWEWVNPPMLPNEEYRTTERYNGKPVYKNAWAYGYMAQTTTEISHGLPVLDSLSIELLNSTQGLTTDIGVKHLTFDRWKIYLQVDWPMGDAIFVMKYTKAE